MRVPPDTIPNSEVKAHYIDDTALRVWDSRFRQEFNDEEPTCPQ